MPDLDEAEDLTQRALDLAHATGDVDLELVALSQLGLIRVGRGDVPGGFALIDEAMAAALAGERSTLDTVVYMCCDMLNACELASDVDRAAQWCQVADSFVDTYGCPFLYAECRIYYGSVLVAKGRWHDAERELSAGLRITEDACPGLHAGRSSASPTCASARDGSRRPSSCWRASATGSRPRRDRARRRGAAARPRRRTRREPHARTARARACASTART